MNFLESPIFPSCPKFGFISDPDYLIDIVATGGGDEYRDVRWDQALRTVTLTVGPGPGGEEEVQDLLEFYHAVRARGGGFRVLDYTDWKSCRTYQTPAPIDQPLVLVEAGIYQLSKLYARGNNLTYRAIYKPFGSIGVADNGTPKTENVDYTVDVTTGLVTLNFSPAGTLTWGGQFHIPCRFNSTFPVEIIGPRLMSVTFSLRELRYEEDEEVT